eukprot:ANDGO_06973.mRNA.1 hypothetical protein
MGALFSCCAGHQKKRKPKEILATLPDDEFWSHPDGSEVVSLREFEVWYASERDDTPVKRPIDASAGDGHASRLVDSSR